MTNWWKDFKRLIISVTLIFSMLFFVFIINQFVQLYHFLALIHPMLAVVTVTITVIALLVVVGKVVRQLYGGETVSEPDPDATEDELDQYYADLIALLQRNPNLEAIDFSDNTLSKASLVQKGFESLDQQTLPLIKQNANAIFLTTAVSQNGSLDSLVVLFSLTRMVWQLAKVYRTRPSLRSLVKLYTQVASVVLMARTLEDADLIESQLEPLISAILGESIASAIPGMVPVTNLIISSLMEGAINAYLTLRVGLITQDYLANYTVHNKQTIRRSAALESLSYMGDIIKQNSKTVIKTVGNAVRNASVGTAKRWFNISGK